jgi:hypothetical protein
VERPLVGSSYEPENVYKAKRTLAPQLKRVAVLPLTSISGEADTEFGRESLSQVLLEELAKTRRFELVVIEPDQLCRLTGRASWTGEERLPWNFFDRIRETVGCDGVLFCRLTHYRAYQPLMIGWHLKLLTVEPRILWSVDEVFDASDPAVARAAQRHAMANQIAYAPRGAESVVLKSPLRFAQYAANAALTTLPKR